MKRLAALLRRFADALDPTPAQRASEIIDTYLNNDAETSRGRFANARDAGMGEHSASPNVVESTDGLGNKSAHKVTAGANAGTVNIEPVTLKRPGIKRKLAAVKKP